MPDIQQIIAVLARTSAAAWPVAVGWHLVVAGALVALLFGRRPTRRALAVLLALPLVSVAALAFGHGGAFNGTLFTLLASAVLLGARRLPPGPAEAGSRWMVAVGGASVALGWAYPELLPGHSTWAHLVGSPMGVLPCPTLLLVLGAGLMAGGLGSRAGTLVMGTVGLFYGLFGALALGVRTDLALVAVGAMALGAALRPGAAHASSEAHEVERARIDAFLALRRVALVGASSDPRHFSRVVMQALVNAGVDVVPVNPSASEVAGRTAFARLDAIQPPVDGALVMTRADLSEEVVEQAAAAGILRVWLHRGAGPGAVSQGAVEAARRHGLDLVEGRCPLMFLGHPPELPHRVHARILALLGRYPAHGEQGAHRA